MRTTFACTLVAGRARTRACGGDKAGGSGERVTLRIGTDDSGSADGQGDRGVRAPGRALSDGRIRIEGDGQAPNRAPTSPTSGSRGWSRRQARRLG